MMAEVAVFISHQSADISLTRAIVQLLEKALKLPARRIRCTSLDGYRLPVGADTDTQLLREVFAARVFLGVITPSSVESQYVLFELGARWGAKTHLAPLLARGADYKKLTGPLAGLNALKLSDRNQVLQLIEDTAQHLEIDLEPLSSFQTAVDELVLQASRPARTVFSDGLNGSDEAELGSESSTLIGAAPAGKRVADPAYDDTATRHSSEKCAFVKLIGKPLAVLVVENGPDSGKWFFITNMNGRVRIGRSPSCEITVSGDPRISRSHCRIEISRTPEKETQPYTLAIIDAGSGNGTVINGSEVQRHELQNLDVIQIGDIRIQFHMLSEMLRH